MPSNQTLILANERGSGGTQAYRERGGSPVLQRVTIVAAQPDATLLYVRADYAPPADDQVPLHGVAAQAIEAREAGRSQTVSDADASSAGEGLALVSRASYPPVHRGVALYATTQNNLARASTPRIDVRA